MTGLSGAGKSSLAVEMDRRLFERGWSGRVLDGDHVRKGLCRDLGFSQQERTENLRRVAEVSRLFCEQGIIVITSFISPLISDREQAGEILRSDFFECFVDAPLETCESRDPKGLYKKARRGEIKDFTGVSAPFEKPRRPDIHIQTHQQDFAASCEQIWKFLLEKGIQ